MRRAFVQRQYLKKIFFGGLLISLLGFASWGFMTTFDSWPVEQEGWFSADTMPGKSGIRRSNIHDRNFDILALSLQLNSLYARPLEIVDPEGTAVELARLLNLDREQLLESFRRERGVVWLTRQAGKEVVDMVLAGNLPGIHVMPRFHRYYPQQTGAAHVVGFVRDEQGLAGIELAYDDILRGGISDIRLAAAGVPERVVAASGVHVVSTLDLTLQQELEQRLARAMRAVDGDSAAAVIMDISRGEVVAMASLPTYDPNRFWMVGTDERLNRAVVTQVHLGALRALFSRAVAHKQGTAAIIPLAGAVDSKRDWYEWEPGIYASANLAGIPRTKTKSAETFLRQIELCAAGALDLLEIRSLNRALTATGGYKDEGATQRAAALRTVSGISLLTAFSRLFNGGEVVEPHLIKGFWDGEQFWRHKPRATEGIFPDAAGQALRQELIAMAGDSKTVVTFESLVTWGAGPGHLFFDEQTKTADLGDLAVVAGPLVNEESEPGLITQTRQESAELASLALPGGTENRQDANLEVEEPRRYQAVMLGMAPARHPTLVALVFIDRARIDLTLPSPLPGIVRDLDRWSATLRHPIIPPLPGIITVREDTLYRQWLSTREKEGLQTQVVGNRSPDYMPDVLGLSLRKALQGLQTSGLRIQVQGSGRVVAQHPAPGVALEGISEGIIELRRDSDNLMVVGNSSRGRQP